VIVIGDEVFTAPEDFLGNTAFARTMIGHLQAVELQQLADFTHAHDGDEFAYLQVATELRISGHAAQRRMTFAVNLTQRLPQTLTALKQGHIEEFKAQLIADPAAPLSAEHAHAAEAAVLDKAAQQTPGQLRNHLAKIVPAVDPEGAEQRRRKITKRERRVEIHPTAPGHSDRSLRQGGRAVSRSFKQRLRWCYPRPMTCRWCWKPRDTPVSTVE